MKTVLLAAAGSLLLAFGAHAADAPRRTDAHVAPAQAAIPPDMAPGAACIDGAAVTPTAYSTDADAESDTSPCSQYLSTQTLVQSPATGRT